MIPEMSIRDPNSFYELAKGFVLASRYAGEMEWQRRLSFNSFSESELLREAAWVILCTGFREAAVRRCFDSVSLSFCDWESAAAIVRFSEHCRASALSSFGNARKVSAILNVAAMVDGTGFATIQNRILRDPIRSLQMFPFIGPVTAYHLAKNLGFDVAKPDRHLVRIATEMGYFDVQEFCSEISRVSGDPIAVVDIVLWRFAEQGGIGHYRRTSQSRSSKNVGDGYCIRRCVCGATES